VVSWGFHDSKADVSVLSQGCRLCGEGEWSCLFINGVCNARCFYCPAKQDERGEPVTSSVTFGNADDYVAYLKEFNYKGASISGGEPFLTFDRTIGFIRKIRAEVGKDIYIWMYTNGILATREKFVPLRDAGLNEVRFDISATGYSLQHLKEVVGIIENITVEIPAIPEDYEMMKDLMKEMKEAGVTFLNLHQIRVTDFNYPKLKERGYTILHGPKATVLESELTALKLLLYSKEENTGVPVNYCSYIYRYRFQGRAARIKQTKFFAEPFEQITETGLLRHIVVKGQRKVLEKIINTLEISGDLRWKDLGFGVMIHADLVPAFAGEEVQFFVSYYATKLRNTLTYHFPYKAIPLHPNRRVVFIEKGKVSEEMECHKQEMALLKKYLFDNVQPLRKEDLQKQLEQHPLAEDRIMSFYHHEKLDFGLYPYF
jgi:pyruvate formate-lyase activating enzyme-like uncharacterized protein